MFRVLNFLLFILFYVCIFYVLLLLTNDNLNRCDDFHFAELIGWFSDRRWKQLTGSCSRNWSTFR